LGCPHSFTARTLRCIPRSVLAAERGGAAKGEF
jgi:hypothetical protein